MHHLDDPSWGCSRLRDQMPQQSQEEAVCRGLLATRVVWGVRVYLSMLHPRESPHPVDVERSLHA